MHGIAFDILILVAVAAGAVVLAELAAGRWVLWLRRRFPWLIVDAVDEAPVLDRRIVDSFLDRSFDPELGWVRKPYEVGKEKLKSAGESELAGYPTSAYRIDAHGARHNPGHDDLPVLISTYGDSFAFSRQVNDDETWQWHLSRSTGTNVSNWGVGNYGIDQAVLRLKREFPKHPSKIVLMAFVPETLVRILSVWKHYFEYGNVLAFKPRFVWQGDRSEFVPNPAHSKEQLLDLAATGRAAQKCDFWYRRKFRRDLLTFPYLASMARTPGRHLPLMTAVALRAAVGCAPAGLRRGGLGAGMKKIADLPWLLTLNENFRFARELDDEPEALQTLDCILGEMLDYADVAGFTPVCVLFPYLHDVQYWREHGWYYPNLRAALGKKVATIDIAEALRGDPHLESYYINDFYGGHLDAAGNEMAGRIIDRQLRSLQLVDSTRARHAA